jgi:ATP-dependent helicase/nuclease subunit B
MALNFLYSDSINKNEYIFEKIKTSIDMGNKILYIVPEQYSFLADKILLDTLGEKYSHLTETLNFKRMAYFINDTYSKKNIEFINEESKNLILYKILKENKLQTIKNRANRPDSILVFKDILEECKRHLIDYDKILEIKEKVIDNKFLYPKISDLELIMREYDRHIKDKYKDFCDSFIFMSKTILEKNLYLDYDIYIDNFTSFTPSEYIVIESLLKNCRNMNITLLTSDLEKKELGDLFFTTYKTYEVLKEQAENQNITITKKNISKEENTYFTSLFSNIDNENIPSNITLFDTKTKKDEVRCLVDLIKNIVKDGAFYSEISIFTGDLDIFSDAIANEFEMADIPYFMDKKVPLIKNPVCRMLLAPLNMVISNYSKDSILEYLKAQAFLYDNHIDICIFEEFINRFNLSGNSVKKPLEWEKNLEIVIKYKSFAKENIELIKNVYNRLIIPVINSFHNKLSNAKDYFEGFGKYILEAKLEARLEQYISKNIEKGEIKQEYIQAYNIFIGAIKNINTLLFDEEVKLTDYFNLLLQSLNVYTTGLVPNSIDKVTISDIERSRDTTKKFVFILGLNDGVTPSIPKNSSFLSDIERELITEVVGVSLPTNIFKNSSSELALYRAFISYTQKLFVLKSQKAEDNSTLMPSFLWARLVEDYEPIIFNKDFVNLTELTINTIKNQKSLPQIEEIEDIRELFSKLDAIRSDGYFNQNRKLEKKLLDTKFAKQLNTSVSRLESYKKCGYSYFIRYLLKIEENENISYDFRKTGSLVHNLIDSFSKKMVSLGIDWSTLEDAFIDDSLPKLVEKELLSQFPDTSLFNPRTKYLIKKLNRIVKNAIIHIKEHFIKGDFIPCGYEIEVSEKGIPPLQIALEDNTIMQIFGKIDRADSLYSEDNPDQLFIRIIDYKSSKKEFNFTLIKEGIQLQLLTYLKALVQNGNEFLDFKGEILPGAALYVSFDDSLVSFPYKPASDEVEKKLREKFMLKGLVLNDNSLIYAIDRELSQNASYKSEICEIKTDKAGNFSFKNILFLEEFKRLLSECETTLKDIGTNIANGEIPLKPYKYGKETGCDYCLYKSICLFDPKIHQYNYIGKLTKDDYFNA